MEIKVLASSSAGNAYLISSGNSSLLIECGLPFGRLQKALDFKLSEIDACLVSHLHADHARSARELAALSIDVFASAWTHELLVVNRHRAIYAFPNEQRQIGIWTIIPFKTIHDCEGSLGFLISDGLEKLVYVTDSSYCPVRFEKIHYWLVEVNYDKETLNENVKSGVLPSEMKNRLLRNHMGLETAIKLFKANDLSETKEIYLIHLSDSNANEERIKQKVQEATGKHVTIAQESYA